MYTHSCEPNLAGLDKAPPVPSPAAGGGGNGGAGTSSPFPAPARQFTVRPGGAAFEVRVLVCVRVYVFVCVCVRACVYVCVCA
jgi:hypothetical protein